MGVRAEVSFVCRMCSCVLQEMCLALVWGACGCPFGCVAGCVRVGLGFGFENGRRKVGALEIRLEARVRLYLTRGVRQLIRGWCLMWVLVGLQWHDRVCCALVCFMWCVWIVCTQAGRGVRAFRCACEMCVVGGGVWVVLGKCHLADVM